MGTSSHLSEPRSSRSYRKRMVRTVVLTRQRWLPYPALCSRAAAIFVSERPLQTCLRTYIFHGAIITGNTKFCFLVFHLTLSHNFFPLVYTDSAITFAEAVSPRLINSRWGAGQFTATTFSLFRWILEETSCGFKDILESETKRGLRTLSSALLRLFTQPHLSFARVTGSALPSPRT